jgi:hypothetical protein
MNTTIEHQLTGVETHSLWASFAATTGIAAREGIEVLLPIDVLNFSRFASVSSLVAT